MDAIDGGDGGVGAGVTATFNEGGRSGSFFYLSANKQFIVKTCSKQELNFLLSIVHAYAMHMQAAVDAAAEQARSDDKTGGGGNDNGNGGGGGAGGGGDGTSRDTAARSLIARIYGCYSIVLYGHTQYFIVVENVLWREVGSANDLVTCSCVVFCVSSSGVRVLL
jgi:hypothetical protein